MVDEYDQAVQHEDGLRTAVIFRAVDLSPACRPPYTTDISKHTDADGLKPTALN